VHGNKSNDFYGEMEMGLDWEWCWGWLEAWQLSAKLLLEVQRSFCHFKNLKCPESSSRFASISKPHITHKLSPKLFPWLLPLPNITKTKDDEKSALKWH
jgi:hypothetical protein